VAKREYQAGVTLSQMGRYTEAKDHLCVSSAYQPNNAYYSLALGVFSERACGVPVDFDTVVGDLPTRALAVADLRESEQWFSRSLKTNPGDDAAMHNLGWIEALRGNWQSAECRFRSSVNTDPRESVYWASLGLTLEVMRKTREAANAYREAVTVEPGFADSALFNRLEARNPDVAANALNGALADLLIEAQQQPSPLVLARLGRLYLSIGQSERAEVCLKAAASILSNLPMVWVNLGTIESTRGRTTSARLYFRRGILLGEDTGQAWFRLAQLEEATGYYNNAAFAYWQAKHGTVISRHAMRVSQMYGVPALTDDILPKGFLEYCRPSRHKTAAAEWLTKHGLEVW
jgi:protein O-GlcNAc transferase